MLAPRLLTGAFGGVDGRDLVNLDKLNGLSAGEVDEFRLESFTVPASSLSPASTCSINCPPEPC